METKYAEDQPNGFTNRIERIAIVGAGGQVGEHLTRGLLKTGKHIVTAISREGSNNTLPDGVQIARVNYEDEASLVSAMKGQQVLLITLRIGIAPDTQSKLIAAAAKAGVKYIMPNAWGINFANEKLAKETLAGEACRTACEEIEKTGVSSYVALASGHWYEYSMSQGPNFYGFDFKNNKVTFFDDGKELINTSTWNLTGDAVGKFWSLPELPQNKNDKAPTISQWKDKVLYISSFLISQRDMLDSVNRVTGKTDSDWTIEHVPSQERYAQGLEQMETDRLGGFAKVLYTRIFFPNGGGNFQDTYGLANEALELPKEGLDEATKRALMLAEKGYNPFLRT